MNPAADTNAASDDHDGNWRFIFNEIQFSEEELKIKKFAQDPSS